MENKIISTFKNNKLLKNIDTSKLNFKDIKGKLVTLKEGEILYREGENSEFVYLIVSGQVKVVEKLENIASNSLALREGDFLGHLDFYETSIRKTSAFGIEDSYLIAVSKAEMNNLLWQDMNILQNLKTLCAFEEPKVEGEKGIKEISSKEEELFSEENLIIGEEQNNVIISEQSDILADDNFDISDLIEKEGVGFPGLEEIKDQTIEDMNFFPQDEEELTQFLESTNTTESIDTDIPFVENEKTEIQFEEKDEDLDISFTLPDLDGDNNITEFIDNNSLITGINEELNILGNIEGESNKTEEKSFEDSEEINFNFSFNNEENFTLQTKETVSNLDDTQPQNISADLPEFIDDEEPENIEMNYSGDLTLNQFSGTTFYNDESEQLNTDKISKNELNEVNLTLGNEEIKDDESADLTSQILRETEDRLFDENQKLVDFSLGNTEPNELDFKLDLSGEKEEPENNFFNDFNDTTLSEYPKENKEDETSINFDLNGNQTDNSLLESYLSQFEKETNGDLTDNVLETELGAIKFEEDDIIKPEGDIEELESMEGFDKDSFLKSEFEDLFPKDNEENIFIKEESNVEQTVNLDLKDKDDLQMGIIEKKEEIQELDSNTNPTKEFVLEPTSNSNENWEKGVMNIEQLQVLLKAAQLVNSNIKLDDVLQNIVSVATNLTNCDRGTLYLVDKEKGEIWSKVVMGNELREIRLKIGDGVSGWVAKTGEIVNISDAQTDSRFKSSFDKTSGYQTKSMICFPIKNVEGEIIGVHQLLNSRNGSFSKLDEAFLNAISIHAAIALENAELVEKLLQFERISSLGKMANFLIQDIKNPVLISKKYAEHLKNKKLPQDADKVLDMILEQLNQVADLVLTTSNYSEKNKVLRQINTNIISVLNDYNSRVDALIKKKNCSITTQFDVDAIVRVDLKEFFQAYQHIVKNAAEAMPDGGTIAITTKKEGNSISISIKDTGLGISDSVKDKIFDPFMSHGKKEGTGLGLSISKKIIEEHAGSITFDSTLGQGSTFVIKLPIAQDF